MKLGVNVNYIASLRNAIGGNEPDLIRSARLCEYAGAEATVVFYDGFDFNVTNSDILNIKRSLKNTFILMIEMNDKAKELALEVKPDIVLIMPEKLGYNDIKRGFNVDKNIDVIKEFITEFKEQGVLVGLFLEPEFKQISSAYKCGIDWVEINARNYSEAFNSNENSNEEFIKLKESAVYAGTMGMNVSVSGGINYKNIEFVRTIPTVKFVNIGHSIITKAIFEGLSNAVKQMKEAINN